MGYNLDIAGHQRRHSSISAVAAPLPKKLILCCDGTWLDSDGPRAKGKNPSNVTRIARAIKEMDDDHHQQIVYYQAGVGTGLGLYDKIAGGGTGAGLAESVREAYSFLVSNYSEQDGINERDSIFLIGFSRGAFTARSIGGFIGAIGVLRRQAMPYFYEIFQDWSHAGDPKHPPQFFKTWCAQHPESKPGVPSDALAGDRNNIEKYMFEYRNFLSINDLTSDADIKCIGVWDTVGSLGIPVNPVVRRLLPFIPSYFREYAWFNTTIDKHVKNAFQALGLDERRFPYSPAVWERPDNVETNLKQVWFAGAHSNVGGSYPDQGMADITLMWMMDQLAGNTRPAGKENDSLEWIKFDEEYITDYNRLQVQEYQRGPPPSFRGWAMGRVIDSLTFPGSLLVSPVLPSSTGLPLTADPRAIASAAQAATTAPTSSLETTRKN
jgi:uncharacterized protein (DUF2235 family)